MNHKTCAWMAFLIAAVALGPTMHAGEAPSAVLLTPPPDMSFAEWTVLLEASGIRLDHAFPPAGGLLLTDNGPTNELLRALPLDTRVFEASPEGFEAELLQSTSEGRLLWHAHRALLGIEASSGEPPVRGEDLLNDALPSPPVWAEAACDSYSLYRTTSEYMLGNVTVTVILPESAGGASTEDWTTTLESNVSNGILQGLNDLSNYYAVYGLSAGLKPTWTYHYILGRTDTRAQLSSEPIAGQGPTGANSLWVNTLYDNLGYTSDADMWAKGRHYNGDQRAADGTDWALTIFVANSVNDSDGKFSDGTFAYAFLGGPYAMMTYDNATWGISQMNVVSRHETSHVFYALDEYAASPCTCAQTSGYVSTQNQNCNKSCMINVPCIMNEWNLQYNVCTYTASQVGWGDSDADKIPDPVDIAPDTALVPYSPDPTSSTSLTFTGTASVQTKTNQNIYHYMCDVNILPVQSVQWRVDGGGWQSASSSDGSFDSTSEGYTFTATVAQGSHVFEARAVDSLGQTDGSPASDTVTVSAGCTDPYEPNDTCGAASSVTCGSSITAKICSISDSDYYSVAPSASGTLSVVLTPPATQDYDLAVLPSDCSAPLCAPGIRGSGQETCAVTTNAGSTYVIAVSGYGGAFDTGNGYQLAVTCSSCTVPSCSSNPAPADGATGIPPAPTLAWDSAEGASAYDLYFGTASPPPLLATLTTTSHAPGTLAPSTTYYWSAVPKNACGTASQCPVWRFTTEVQTPPCASGPTPSDGATGVSLAPALTWGPASGAVSYDVYFGTSSPPPHVASVSAVSYSPAGLAAGTRYYWGVVPRNAGGPAQGCPTWGFTTAVNPPLVTLVGRLGAPFRIKILGGNLQSGLSVHIAGQLWGSTSNPSAVKWKSGGEVILKKGAALKSRFPAGVFVPIRITNPDGGLVTVEYERTSNTWRLAS